MNSRKSPSAYDNVYATTTSGSALQRLFSIGPMEERYEISISFLNSFVTSSNEDPVLDNEDLNIVLKLNISLFVFQRISISYCFGKPLTNHDKCLQFYLIASTITGQKTIIGIIILFLS